MVATKRNTKKRGGWFGSSPKQVLPEHCVVFKDHLENLVKEFENNYKFFQMPNNESEDGKYKTFKIIEITKIIKEVDKGNIFTSDKITYNLTGNEHYPTSKKDGPKTIIIPGNKNDKMMNAIIKIYKDKPTDISKAQLPDEPTDISKAQLPDEPTDVVAVGGHTMRNKHRRKSTKKLAKSRRRKIGTKKSVSK